MYIRIFTAILLFCSTLQGSISAPLPQDCLTEEKKWTSLHAACSSDDIEYVRHYFLENSNNAEFNPNIKCCYGTPLHVACTYGAENVFYFLFAQPKIRKYCVNDQGSGLLHTAAEFGHTSFIEFLISKGLYVKARNKNNITPLHYACENGYVDITKILLLSGAEVNAQDSSGMTPLHYACDQGKSDIVRLLDQHGADFTARDEDTKTPIDYAWDKKHFEIIEYCLSKESPILDQIIISILHHNLSTQDPEEALESFIKHLDYNSLTTISMLIKKLDVDSLRQIATIYEHHTTSRGSCTETLLHAAVQKNNTELLSQLIEKNIIDINETDGECLTPLHLACQNGKIEIARLFVRKGADLEVASSLGKTPLEYLKKYCINTNSDFEKMVAYIHQLPFEEYINDMWNQSNTEYK